VGASWDRSPRVLATLALVFTLAGVGVLLWTLQFGAKKDDVPTKPEAGVVAAGQTTEHPIGVKNAKDGKPEEDQAKAEALRKQQEEKAQVVNMARTFAETAKQAAQAAESAVAEAEKAVEKARSAALQAKGVGAGSAASQADQAVTDVMDAIAKARTAANNANQAAAEATKVVNADDSAVKTVLDAAGATDQAAAEAKEKTEKVEGAIKKVREATGIAKDAVNKIRAIEVPFELPAPTLPQSSIAAESPPAAIPQLQGIPATSISTLGLGEVFSGDPKVDDDRQGQSLDYYASRGSLARQRIAHITTTPNEPPRFQWDDQARNIPEKADLLRNCLLQVEVLGYTKFAYVRLRRARTGEPLRLTGILHRGKVSASPRVSLGSIPPGKTIALRLEGIPEGWKIAPEDSSRDRCKITVRGDVELHFHCQVKEQEDKPKKSQQHPVGPYDKEYQVVFTYSGAGASLEAIYPVWQEDLRIFEQERQRQLQAEVEAAARAGDTATLAALDAELSSPQWRNPPPPALAQAAAEAKTTVQYWAVQSQLEGVAAELEAALLQARLDRGVTLYTQWNDIIIRTGWQPHPHLVKRTAPALQWVQRHLEREAAVAALADALDKELPAAKLKAAYRRATESGSLDDSLEERYQTQFASLQRAAKWLLGLKIGAGLAAGIAVALLIGWVVSHERYEQEIASASKNLPFLIDRGDGRNSWLNNSPATPNAIRVFRSRSRGWKTSSSMRPCGKPSSLNASARWNTGWPR
jgi:hypothetical protein